VRPNENDNVTLISRRAALAVSAAAAVAPLFSSNRAAAQSVSKHVSQTQGAKTMNFITTKDATKIAYKDWGKGQPILFSHGWPLTGDAWEAQMLFFGQNGYRVIAHDRRGHGKSDQPWDGNNMDQYADDLAELIEKLDLKNLVMVGHSTGGGEVAHYIGRHGSKRVAKVVLVGAVPPLMLKTDANPEGTPIGVFNDIRKGAATNRSQFFKDLTIPFYGFNRLLRAHARAVQPGSIKSHPWTQTGGTAVGRGRQSRMDDNTRLGRQKLVDLRSRLAHHVLQVPVERLHHIRDALAADRFFALHNAIPDVAVGFPVHQLHLQ
jgi:pimeloyl-ACP methyl ester carboxylesterase